MPRANRFYLSDAVWHITHRCHDQKFLLKFERDRLRWKYWLFQVCKRYGLSVRCLVYIDLNMVRARVVDHPAHWNVCGFREIQSPPHRYRIIDRQTLSDLTNIPSAEAFRTAHKYWVENCLKNGKPEREPVWTESVAVGSETYVDRVKSLLGARAYHRPIAKESDHTFLIQDSGGVTTTLSAAKSGF